MDGNGAMTALILIVLLLNAVVLFASWRITLSNRRSLEGLYERERRAKTVLHEAALERGQVLSLIHGDRQVA